MIKQNITIYKINTQQGEKYYENANFATSKVHPAYEVLGYKVVLDIWPNVIATTTIFRIY